MNTVVAVDLALNMFRYQIYYFVANKSLSASHGWSYSWGWGLEFIHSGVYPLHCPLISIVEHLLGRPLAGRCHTPQWGRLKDPDPAFMKFMV